MINCKNCGIQTANEGHFMCVKCNVLFRIHRDKFKVSLKEFLAFKEHERKYKKLGPSKEVER